MARIYKNIFWGSVVSALAMLLVSVLLMASVPPVDRDALTHHLAVPKLYLLAGSVIELPHIIFSYYPQLLDFIYLIPLSFGNDILPKWIHFSFALLTSFFIWLFLRQKADRFWALCGSALFLSTPVIIKLSTSVYVDLGLIFFSFMSLYMIYQWKEKAFETKYLILCGLFCGLSAGTKYNGLITVFLLPLFVSIIFVRYSEKKNCQLKAMGYGVLVLIIAMVVFSPWAIKNYHWTKNPVYPLYNSTIMAITGEAVNQAPTEAVSNVKLNHFQIRKFVYKESALETFFIPLRIFFQGEDDNPALFDGKLMPVLIVFPLIGLFIYSKDQGRRFDLFFWSGFAFLYIIIVFVRVDMRVRWVGPAIPPLIIVTIIVVRDLWEKSLKMKKSLSFISRTLLLFTLSFTFFLNFHYCFSLFQNTAPLSYLSGKILRDDYIQKRRPEYASFQYANEHLKGKDNIKILGLFLGNRRYYCDLPLYFNQAAFKKAVSDRSENIGIQDNLKQDGFTHIIVGFGLMNQWVNANFSFVEQSEISALFQSKNSILFAKDGYGLFAL